MGNPQSRPTLECTPQSLSIAPKYMGSYGECFFRNEYFLSPFNVNSNSVEFNTDLVRVHRPDDLVNLLAGCYEQLNSIPEILETLIQLNFTHDHVLISALDDSFRGYQKLGLFRAVAFDFVQKMEHYRAFNLEERTHKPRRTLSVATLISAIKSGFDGQENNELFEKIKAYYSEITPASCVAAPVPMFWGNGVGC